MTKGHGAVLVIEDDIDIQNFISRSLELEGYDVYRAEDGATGLDIVRKDPISLVLLDLRLPGSDGWSVLRDMKRNPVLSMIPVIVLTSTAESAQRRRTLRMGAHSYLIKPISAHDLVKTVRIVFERKARRLKPGLKLSPTP